jgi:hypothetical protein
MGRDGSSSDMSIKHLSYAMCDICSDPAECGDNAAEAREFARCAGWKRVGKRDICPRHIKRSSLRGTWWIEP